jgi:thiamine-phosphate pyrophosphorylase
MRFELPRLYPITSAEVSGLSHSDQVERLAAGGATLIQLREKRASPREFFHAVVEAMTVARRAGVRIIVNDRIDIAIAAGADGVHLGQDDIPPEDARRILGNERIIGYSTHSLRQALEANELPVDYVAIGPVFNTLTKANPDPVVGLDLVRDVSSTLSKPLVAIGGINLENAASVIEAGAGSVAVISDLVASRSITEKTRLFLRALPTR